MDHYDDDRTNKDLYFKHMRKTLVLVIAAIHQKAPEIYGSRLRPVALTPPQSASREMLFFHHRAVSMAWKSFLSCWTWVGFVNSMHPAWLMTCILSSHIMH
jgi:hypothetical protein